jgi:hypothetical protein
MLPDAQTSVALIDVTSATSAGTGRAPWHSAALGEMLLSQLVDRVREAVPPGATVTKVGAAELAVLLPGLTRQQADEWAEQLRGWVAGLGWTSVGLIITVRTAMLGNPPAADRTPTTVQPRTSLTAPEPSASAEPAWASDPAGVPALSPPPILPPAPVPPALAPPVPQSELSSEPIHAAVAARFTSDHPTSGWLTTDPSTGTFAAVGKPDEPTPPTSSGRFSTSPFAEGAEQPTEQPTEQPAEPLADPPSTGRRSVDRFATEQSLPGRRSVDRFTIGQPAARSTPFGAGSASGLTSEAGADESRPGRRSVDRFNTDQPGSADQSLPGRRSVDRISADQPAAAEARPGRRSVDRFAADQAAAAGQSAAESSPPGRRSVDRLTTGLSDVDQSPPGRRSADRLDAEQSGRRSVDRLIAEQQASGLTGQPGAEQAVGRRSADRFAVEQAAAADQPVAEQSRPGRRSVDRVPSDAEPSLPGRRSVDRILAEQAAADDSPPGRRSVDRLTGGQSAADQPPGRRSVDRLTTEQPTPQQPAPQQPTPEQPVGRRSVDRLVAEATDEAAVGSPSAVDEPSTGRRSVDRAGSGSRSVDRLIADNTTEGAEKPAPGRRSADRPTDASSIVDKLVEIPAPVSPWSREAGGPPIPPGPRRAEPAERLAEPAVVAEEPSWAVPPWERPTAQPIEPAEPELADPQSTFSAEPEPPAVRRDSVGTTSGYLPIVSPPDLHPRPFAAMPDPTALELPSLRHDPAPASPAPAGPAPVSPAPATAAPGSPAAGPAPVNRAREDRAPAARVPADDASYGRRVRVPDAPEPEQPLGGAGSRHATDSPESAHSVLADLTIRSGSGGRRRAPDPDDTAPTRAIAADEPPPPGYRPRSDTGRQPVQPRPAETPAPQAASNVDSSSLGWHQQPPPPARLASQPPRSVLPQSASQAALQPATAQPVPQPPMPLHPVRLQPTPPPPMRPRPVPTQPPAPRPTAPQPMTQPAPTPDLAALEAQPELASVEDGDEPVERLSPGANRRRTRSNMRLADLLTEALLAYQDVRDSEGDHDALRVPDVSSVQPGPTSVPEITSLPFAPDANRRRLASGSGAVPHDDNEDTYPRRSVPRWDRPGT